MTEEENKRDIVASGGPASGIRSVTWRILTLEPKWFDIAFTTVLLAFIGVLIVKGLSIDERAKWVPLVVAVPTFILLAVILLTLISERVSNFTDQYAEESLFGVDEEKIPGRKDAASADEPASDREKALYRYRKRQIIAFLSVIALLVMVYLFGFMASIPIFLVVLYRWWAGQSWLVTLVTTIFVWLFVLVVFYTLLGVRLYKGVFNIDIMGFLPL